MRDLCDCGFPGDQSGVMTGIQKFKNTILTIGKDFSGGSVGNFFPGFSSEFTIECLRKFLEVSSQLNTLATGSSISPLVPGKKPNSPVLVLRSYRLCQCFSVFVFRFISQEPSVFRAEGYYRSRNECGSPAENINQGNVLSQ